MHRVATTPAEDLNDPLADELQNALPTERSAATVVPALLGVRSIFDTELAANTTFADLLAHWYRIIDTNGLDGLRKEITHG
jgi:fructuronate reductase